MERFRGHVRRKRRRKETSSFSRQSVDKELAGFDGKGKYRGRLLLPSRGEKNFFGTGINFVEKGGKRETVGSYQFYFRSAVPMPTEGGKRKRKEGWAVWQASWLTSWRVN